MWMRNVRYGALFSSPSDFISHHRHHLFTIFSWFFSLLDWCVRLILLSPLSVISFSAVVIVDILLSRCRQCLMSDALMPWCPIHFLSIHFPASIFPVFTWVRLIVEYVCWMLNVVNVCHPIYFVCIYTEKGQCIQNNDKCKGDEKHLNGSHFVIE